MELIFDFLAQAAIDFGEPADRAFAQAERRIHAIENAVFALGSAPHQGTSAPDLLPGLRRVTKERAIIYFCADDMEQRLSVLAVFFGGQDHQRHMLARLLERE